MPSETPQSYDFANFRLDLSERVLLHGGRQIALTPKALHLLKILVENHGHIVDKQKLIEEIWPDSFVEDGNLAVSANLLRKALDDDAVNPRFIETIPRRGYRFIADVSVTKAEDSGDAPIAAAAGRRGISTVILFAGAIAAVAAGFAVWKFVGASDEIPLLATKFSSEKITSSGNVEIAAISPDGKYAAYIDAVGRAQSVWMRQIESGESIQIVPPSANHYFHLTFSRDGNSLFFIRRTEEYATPALYRVTALGGVPVKILDDVIGFASISHDDNKISFVRCSFKADDFCSLLVADADGKNERRVLTRQAPNHLTYHGFSPDDRSIAIASGNSFDGSGNRRIIEVDVETGANREMANRGFFDIKGVGWLSDGSGVIVSGKEFLDGKVSLWYISRATGETTRLTDNPNSFFTVSLSAAGDRMISTQVSNNYRLYYSAGGVERPLAAARDFAFAPNGKIIYASDDRNIWEINADGSGQRQLTTDPATDFSPRVSHDGRYIYFASDRSGVNQVWRMDADGINQIQITKNEGGFPRLVSKDGSVVFYLSGKNERLRKVVVDTGEETEVTPKKLFSPAISPNGEMVAYFFRDPWFKIGVLRVVDQKLIKVIEHGDGKSFPLICDWSPDSRSIYFVAVQDDRSMLWQHSIDARKPNVVADLGSEDVERFAPSPDGSAFAYTRGKWLHDAILLTGLK